MSIGAYIATVHSMFESGRCCIVLLLTQVRQADVSVCPALKCDDTSSHPPTVPFPCVVLHHVYVAIRTGDGGLVLLQMCAAKL